MYVFSSTLDYQDVIVLTIPTKDYKFTNNMFEYAF